MISNERALEPSTRSGDWTSRLLLLAAAGLFAIIVAREFNGIAPEIVGKPAPPLIARQLDGTPLSLAALAGNVVLLDFWSTACGPCVAQIPTLAAIESRFRGRPFRLLSLSVEPSEWPNAGTWLRQRMPTSLIGTVDPPAVRAYGATRLPRLVVIGADGVVANAFTGLTTGSTLTAAIERLIAR